MTAFELLYEISSIMTNEAFQLHRSINYFYTYTHFGLVFSPLQINYFIQIKPRVSSLILKKYMRFIFRLQITFSLYHLKSFSEKLREVKVSR